jgi:hypothetical protein
VPYKLCPTCKTLVPSRRYREHRRTAHGRPGSPPGWKKLRAKIIARDGGHCAQCPRIDSLSVHHIDGNPFNDAESNLSTRCPDHHPLYARWAMQDQKRRITDERVLPPH